MDIRKSISAIFSFSPIKFRRMAIFTKKPNYFQETSLIYNKISESQDNIVYSKDFKRKLNQKYDGFLAYNKSNDLIGYYWYTIDIAPPTSIPKIPKNSVWIFNMLVFEEFRGKGLQKDMLKHFENEFINYCDLYADVLLGNTPSIKSFLKSGYLGKGIYFVLIFGIRRYKHLNFKMGYWAKNMKHWYK